jgi:hypothetical protein
MRRLFARAAVVGAFEFYMRAAISQLRASSSPTAADTH